MKKPILKKAYYYGALAYAFLVPFHQKLATLALIVWALLSLISFERSAVVKNRLLILLPLLYAVYFLGLFTAENPSFGFLETKLSFLVFPLIFFLHQHSKSQRKNILKALVYGVVLSGISCLAYATYRSVGFEGGMLVFTPNVLEGKGFAESILYGGNYYFSIFFSVFHQTVYYALYVSITLAAVLFRADLFGWRTRVALIVFFIVLLFLIANKAAIVGLGVIVLLRMFTAKMPTYKKVAGIVVLGLVVGLFIWMNPRTRTSLKLVGNGALNIEKNARYGFKTRLLSWDAALALIKERPFLGYGSGDAQKKLNEVYQQKEYVFPLKEAYNAHNLWLQTWLENGLPGLLLLGFLFTVLFRSSFKGGSFDPFLFTLIGVLFVNTLFESMFHRFSGISFFAFLTCYIITAQKGKEVAP